jgi:hypothetical protein
MSAPPANFEHCTTIYDMMATEAKTEEIDGTSTLVWEGHTTKLFEKAALAQPYYTSVLHKLRAMGCILQLQRGGGGGFSKWALLTSPTLSVFDASKDRASGRPTPADIQNQRLRDVMNLITTVNSHMDSVESWLHNLDKDVNQLLIDVEALKNDD